MKRDDRIGNIDMMALLIDLAGYLREVCYFVDEANEKLEEMSERIEDASERFDNLCGLVSDLKEDLGLVKGDFEPDVDIDFLLQ